MKKRKIVAFAILSLIVPIVVIPTVQILGWYFFCWQCGKDPGPSPILFWAIVWLITGAILLAAAKLLLKGIEHADMKAILLSSAILLAYLGIGSCVL